MSVKIDGSNGLTFPDSTSQSTAVTLAGLLGTGVTISTTAPANTMVITSNGRLGVGTDSPDFQLDVSGTSASTTTSGVGIGIENWSTTTDSRAGVVFRNYDNSGASIWSTRTGSSKGTLVFGTNNGGGLLRLT
jgi:hypothetical protein